MYTVHTILYIHIHTTGQDQTPTQAKREPRIWEQ